MKDTSRTDMNSLSTTTDSTSTNDSTFLVMGTSHGEGINSLGNTTDSTETNDSGHLIVGTSKKQDINSLGKTTDSTETNDSGHLIVGTSTNQDINSLGNTTDSTETNDSGHLIVCTPTNQDTGYEEKTLPLRNRTGGSVATDLGFLMEIPPCSNNDLSDTTVQKGFGSVSIRRPGRELCVRVAELQQNYDRRRQERHNNDFIEDDLAKSTRNRIRLGLLFPDAASSTNEVNHGFSNRETSFKKSNCCAKGILCVFVSVLAVVGMGAMVHFLGERYPDVLPGGILDNGIVRIINIAVKLKDRIHMSTEIDPNVADTSQTLTITPPFMVNDGQYVLLDVNHQIDKRTTGFNGWGVEYNSLTKMLDIAGPQTTCVSGGVYNIQLMDSHNVTIYSGKINVTIESEVGSVDVSLNQSFNDSTSEGLELSCKVAFGCEQSYLELFADINGKEEYIRGLRSMSTKAYTANDGYTESLTLFIPEHVRSISQRMICRPKAVSLKEADIVKSKDKEAVLELSPLQDCDIAKHCGFVCSNNMYTDYYAVHPTRCDVFHRCVNKIVYTYTCPTGTFFDPQVCTCTNAVNFCHPNGEIKKNQNISELVCGIS